MQIHALYTCTIKKLLAREKVSKKSPRDSGRYSDIKINEMIILLINSILSIVPTRC